MPAPACVPLEIRTDERGCQYYDCGKSSECPDLDVMYFGHCADGSSPNKGKDDRGCDYFYCDDYKEARDEYSECSDGCQQECGDQNTDCVDNRCVCKGYGENGPPNNEQEEYDEERDGSQDGSHEEQQEESSNEEFQEEHESQDDNDGSQDEQNGITGEVVRGFNGLTGWFIKR